MMMKTMELALIGAIASVFIVSAYAQEWNEEQETEQNAARDFMRMLNQDTAKEANKQVIALWEYNTNITEYNENVYTQVALEAANIYKANWEKTITYKWQDFQDEDLKRQFSYFSILGSAALPEDENQKLIEVVTRMSTTYSTAKVCDYRNKTKCDLYIEPEIRDIFSTSRDPEELKYYWIEWHKAAGAPSRRDYEEYVALSNKAAKANGFNSTAEWWLNAYENGATGVEDQFAKMWSTIRPLYQQLHAYIRRQLRLKYGDDLVSAKGPIPGHLLGNIWAQSFVQTLDFTRPFPNKTERDITSSLIQQNKTVHDHIKYTYFETTHHEMGHIEYYLQYKDLPYVYRDGPNPGFHEAVGDTISLSVASPKHLKVIGLLEDTSDDNESNINTLYEMALNKIAFLPYGYILDLYRYSVFRGTTTPDNYNCHFWQLRDAIQGIVPPVTRTEEDFDPAAKYHISADVEYMRYYISFIIQFQFHRSLCQLADQYTPGDDTQPLFNCDIYNSTAAGNAFKKMLSLGSSKPWPDAMQALTGQREMDAEAILEYFQPLHEWLQAENERTGEYIGWEDSSIEYCTAEQLYELENSEFKKKLKKQSGDEN